MAAQAIKIKPVDCIPQEALQENILQNLKLIKEWAGPCRVNEGTAWLFSAGHSLDFATNSMFTKEYFLGLPKDSYGIFCIKHALPQLAKAGIVPNFCVALDPRDIKGTSTHDIVREDLYAAAPRETIMMIASMTHPSVTEYLLMRGYRVIGWHAASSVINDLVEKQVMKSAITIAGGTSSAMRAISLVHHLGYRKAKCIGYDCSLAGPPPEDQRDITVMAGPAEGKQKEKPKYVEVFNPADKRDRFSFWSTGELIAQAQDIEATLQNMQLSDLEVRFYGMDPQRSYGGNIVEHTKNNTIFPSVQKRFAH